MDVESGNRFFFSDDSRFNLGYSDGRIRDRLYTSKYHPQESVNKVTGDEDPALWLGVRLRTMNDLICYKLGGNLNNNWYMSEILKPEVVTFF